MSEFSRIWRIDALGTEPKRVELAADERERSALAQRFGLVAIERLEAEATLARSGDTVIAAGTLRGDVTQSCVATGDPVQTALEEPFRIEFRPHPAAAGSEAEVELGKDELDVVFHDGASVDLGEAVAETLSLALDPWPRSPRAEAALKEAGVKDEAEAGARGESSPFAGLAKLRDKLGG